LKDLFVLSEPTADLSREANLLESGREWEGRCHVFGKPRGSPEGQSTL
jgi:hypothetical protein